MSGRGQPSYSRGRGAPGRGGTAPGGPGRGPPPPGAQRGAPQGTVQAAVPYAPNVIPIGIKRPGYGTAGKRITVKANVAEITLPDDTIYHYDVGKSYYTFLCRLTNDFQVITPTRPPRVNLQIIKVLQDGQQQIFTPKAVYDGRKNMFSNHELDLGPDESREFNVIIDDNPNPKRPPLPYKVRLARVSTINLAVLDQFVNRTMSQTNDVQTAITALNVVMRMELIQRYPHNTRSFFINAGSKDVGYGLQLWRGYFQSIRPALGRMLINLDTATGMFYKPGPLITLCLDYLGAPQRNPQLFSPERFPARKRIELQRFITGLRISTRDNNVQRTYTIKGITQEGANQLVFQRDGQPSTVAQYYASTNRTLQHPNIICIKTAKGALIPLEHCTVIPGQIARKEVPPEIRTDLLRFSSQPPAERFRAIADGIPALQYGQSEYVRQFGINVQTTGGAGSFPLEVEARVLSAPDLEYANQKISTPRFGAWNMIDRQFVKPATIDTWIIVIYEGQNSFPVDDAKNLARDFIRACSKVGIRVTDNTPLIKYENGQNPIETLRTAGQECFEKKGARPNFIVVILPKGGNDIYRAVKHFGNATVGVATQCLLASNCRKANDQFWANVLLKVNPKLSGINWRHKEVAALSDPTNPVVIMGADVIHPPPGGSRSSPSFAALVTSVDSKASFYISTDRMQTSRQELIDDMFDMSVDNLKQWKNYQSVVEKRTIPPKRIIFFRDGVSEGQFDQVKGTELPALQRACQSLGISPRITFVVVGKRHHTRFDPVKDTDRDKSGNCPAGTVVDRDITHPVEYDFFLQSHAGLKGTSRPAHYTVLHDENQFSPDALQAMCYSLCHIFARSTRSVSIPAPVFYADLACTQAKLRFDPTQSTQMSDTASQTEEESMARYQDAWRPLHGNMSKRMYFL